MQKHAYLIMAHNEPQVFRSLLSLLDDGRNDLFVHIDRKAAIDDFEFVPQHSRICYVDRLDVRWGGFSQIAAELTLMEKASSVRAYAYYHLLSGVDLPLRSQDEIHAFFDGQPVAKEYVGFAQYTDSAWMDRARYFHPFVEQQKSGGRLFQKALRACDKVAVSAQKLLGVRRASVGFRKGPQWFSITDDLCRYVLNQREMIEVRFKHISCVDEWFLQTLVYNHPTFWQHVYDATDEFGGCLRAIDWQRGSMLSPYTWGADSADDDILMQSGCLFARKFSTRYQWLVDRIVNRIQNQ